MGTLSAMARRPKHPTTTTPPAPPRAEVRAGARQESGASAVAEVGTPSKALWLIRGAALWLIAGALAKAFTGTPSELPAPILNSSLDPFQVISGAVVLETIVAVVALARPRIGWIPLAGALLTFSVLLLMHMESGADHCGCFGGALPIPAWVMLATDASLAIVVIAAAIASRSWNILATISSGMTSGLAVASLGGGFLGLGLGWHADARLRPLRPIDSSQVSGAGTGAPHDHGENQPNQPIIVPMRPPDVAPKAWSLPAQFPSEVILRPITWLNKPLASTELGRWTDTSKFPPNAQLILYYESCSHCAEHLRELAAKQAAGDTASPDYVLVQLPTPKAPNMRIFVDTVPNGMHVALPEEITRWVITPPWDVWIEGGLVKRAERIKWPGEK